MKKIILFLIACAIISLSQAQTLSGTYTLGGTGSDFLTFTDFANEINAWGMSGVVIVNVVPTTGPFLEQFILGEISGSSLYTLTINGNGETLRFLSTNPNEPATIRLNGTDNVNINNLIVVADGENTGEYGFAVWLANGADNNTFNNCQFVVTMNSTLDDFIPFVTTNFPTNPVMLDQVASNLTVSNCITEGGYYGMIIKGSNNEITNNHVKDFYSYGLWVGGFGNSLISENTISRPERTDVSTTYMINLKGNFSGTSITRNRLIEFAGNAITTSPAYGIYGEQVHSSLSNEMLLANNVISGFQNMNGIQYGIYMNGTIVGLPVDVRIYHNSVALDHINHPGTSTIYGFYITGHYEYLDIRNNIISYTTNSTGTKYCLYFTSNHVLNSTITCDYNVLHRGSTVGTGHTGFWINASYFDLENWQTANGGIFDQNSSADDPIFVNLPPDNLLPSNSIICNLGADLTEFVPDDINGVLRHPVTPDPGAYEFEGQPGVCPPPVNLIATNITSTTAMLTWTSFSGLSDIEYGPAGFVSGTGIFLFNVSSPQTISTLIPCTSYDFYVRDNCGGGNYSSWVGPYIFTTQPSSSQSIIYKELTHTSLGCANLDVNNDTLEVNNIGTSGSDGFSVDLSDHPYLTEWGTEIAQDLQQMPENARINVAPKGSVAGLTDQTICSSNYHMVDDTIVAAYDFTDLGADSVFASFYRNDTLVADAVIPYSSFELLLKQIPDGKTGPGALVSALGKGADSAGTNITVNVTITKGDTDKRRWKIRLKNCQNCTVNIYQKSLKYDFIIVDSLKFEPNGNTSNDVVLTSSEITAANLSSLSIVDEYVLSEQTVVYKDLQHTSLGSATLEVNNDTLEVNNIGTSGSDGFSVDLSDHPYLTEWGTEIAQDLQQMPENARINVASKGSITGLTDQTICSSNYHMVDDTIVAAYDFTDLGADSVFASFYRNDTLVADAVIPYSSFELILKQIPDGKTGPGALATALATSAGAAGTNITVNVTITKGDTDKRKWVTKIRNCQNCTVNIYQKSLKYDFIIVDSLKFEPNGNTVNDVVLTSSEITAANLSSLSIVDEYVLSEQTVGTDLTVFLEGPFNGSAMTQGLTDFMPLVQPYSVSPWNYSGSENVIFLPANTIDWVLIELRDAPSAAEASSATRIARQAAFIRSDGKVTDLTGNPELNFGALNTSNNLYVVVYHRNHLSILSANGLIQTNGIYSYDFSTGSGQAYGGALAQKEIAPGVWGMYGGDGDANGLIDYYDKDPVWESEAGTQGYIASDYNLDVHSNNQDKDDIWEPNLGAESQVPAGETFTCGSLLLDARDGQSYQTVLIGDQCWMAKNLNIGSMIDGSTNQTDNSTIEKYCYDNNTTNCDVYGGLYQWDEAMQYTLTPGVPGICPPEWHLPTDEEWCTLEQLIEPTIPCDRTWFSGNHAGGDLKETGTIHWQSPNLGATNVTGYTALPGGKRDSDSFDSFHYFAFYWTSNEYDMDWGWCRALHYDYASIRRAGDPKLRGYSVRCLKDEYINQPPSAPSDPQPPDGAMNQPINTILLWECMDIENDPLTYDVYFGPTNPPGLAISGQIEATYDPSALDYDTPYFWKIVAHDDQGNTTVGTVWSFTTITFPCGNVLTDTRDNQTYTTVQIGDQCWMAENLNIGEMIPSINDMTDYGEIEKYCFGNIVANCAIYGGLYQWDEMMQYTTQLGARGICPTDWHIPSDAEWTILTNFLDGESVAGGKMKEIGTTLWSSPNTGATNSSGFTALPGGYRHYDGGCVFTTIYAYFWSSSGAFGFSWYRELSFDNASVYHDIYSQSFGLSVRCLHD